MYKSKLIIVGVLLVKKMQTLFVCHRDSVAIFFFNSQILLQIYIFYKFLNLAKIGDYFKKILNLARFGKINRYALLCPANMLTDQKYCRQKTIPTGDLPLFQAISQPHS